MKCSYKYNNKNRTTCAHEIIDSENNLCIFHADVDHPNKDAELFKKKVRELIEESWQFFGAQIAAFDDRRISLTSEKAQQMAIDDIETNMTGFRFPENFHFPVNKAVNVNLQGASFAGDAKFQDIHITGNLSLEDATIKGTLKIAEATIDGTVLLMNGTFYNDVIFETVEIKGNVYLNRAKIRSLCTFRDINIGQDLLMYETRVYGQLLIGGGKIKGVLKLIWARLHASFELKYIELKDLTLSDAHINGDLIIEKTTINKNAKLSLLSIERQVAILNTTINGEFDFSENHISGEVHYHKVDFNDFFKLNESVFAEGLEITDSKFYKRCNFNLATIVRFFRIIESNFNGKVYFHNTKFYSDKQDQKNIANIFSSNFDQGAIFSATDFKMPLAFRYIDLSNIHFEYMNFSSISLLKCNLNGANFLTCDFIEQHEKGWCRLFNTKYPELLDHRILLGKDSIRVLPEEKTVNIQFPVTNLNNTPDEWELTLKAIEWTIPAFWPRENLTQGFWTSAKSDHNAEKNNHKTTKNEYKATPDEILTQYQAIKRNMENSGNPVEAGEFYFAEMEFKREIKRNDIFDKSKNIKSRIISCSSYFFHNLYRLLNGYGERPIRTMGWIALLLFISTLAYLQSGLAYNDHNFLEITQAAETRTGSKLWVTIDYDWGFSFSQYSTLDFWSELLVDFGQALKFSLKNIVPFIDRQESYLKPLDSCTITLKMFEQFLGSGLIAFFLLALRRRFKR